MAESASRKAPSTTEGQQLNKLALNAQNGDDEAFGQIFDEISDRIYRFLAFRVVNQEDAKDLTSQTFLEAWQNLSRFDPNKSFLTWIFTIARYKLIDHYRKYKSTVSLDAVTNLADSTDIQTETENKAASEQVLSALNRLPELYQTVLKLKLVEELKYSEIAEITGRSENNLRVIVKRGLDKLRSNL